MFFSAERCGKCNDWMNAAEGREVEEYRALVSGGMDPLAAVAAMHGVFDL